MKKWSRLRKKEYELLKRKQQVILWHEVQTVLRLDKTLNWCLPFWKHYHYYATLEDYLNRETNVACLGIKVI